MPTAATAMLALLLPLPLLLLQMLQMLLLTNFLWRSGRRLFVTSVPLSERM